MRISAGRAIVVGVDGSPPSLRALAWAVGEAATLRGTVRVVTAWHSSSRESERVARAGTAERTAFAAAALYAGGDVPVTAEAAEGDAWRALTEAARGASMLVVGSRGRGVLAGTVLGSVALSCISHASCPVVVVRDGRAGREAAEDESAAIPAQPARATAAATSPDQPADAPGSLRSAPLGEDHVERALQRHLAAEQYRIVHGG